MPIRKLVELNGKHGGWLEIDPIKTKRVASNFKKWLLTIDPNHDPFLFLKYDLPLVDAVLNNQVSLPYKGNRPHTRALGEGLLPREYTIISAPFYNTIFGALYAPPEVIMKDNKYYAWTEFEDPE